MRIRPLLPLLLSSVAWPVYAGDTGTCHDATDSVRCLIEQAEFTRLRNAEVDASMARVERVRWREYIRTVTHCDAPLAQTPRCMAERDREFVARQNALSSASSARVAAMRAVEAARRAGIAHAVARVEARRQKRLEQDQRKLAAASLHAVEIERVRRFAAHQNELSAASSARVAAERRRQLAILNAPCTSPSDPRQRCIEERTYEFVEHQNVLATASSERVRQERERAFAAARNAEATASMIAVERARIYAVYNRVETASIKPAPLAVDEYTTLTSYCVNSPNSPRCAAERIRAVAATRNAEIAASAAAARVKSAGTLTANEYSSFTSHCVRNSASPRCTAERIREAATVRNNDVNAGIAASRIAATGTLSAAEYAALTSHCVRNAASPRCAAERIRDAAAARNNDIDAANADSKASSAGRLSAAEYAALTSHCVRNATSPRCAAERLREFAAARNLEIDRSLARVAAARAAGEVDFSYIGGHPASRHIVPPLETGAIGRLPSPDLMQPDLMQHDEPQNQLRRGISNDPCRLPSLQPINFTRGARINVEVEPELDRLAELTETCPGMRIEVHGYSDANSSFGNRALAQNRAKSVADYLIAAGVAPHRVSAISRGSVSAGAGYAPAYGDRAELIVRNPGTDAAARQVMWDMAELLDPNYIPAVANLSP